MKEETSSSELCRAEGTVVSWIRRIRERVEMEEFCLVNSIHLFLDECHLSLCVLQML